MHRKVKTLVGVTAMTAVAAVAAAAWARATAVAEPSTVPTQADRERASARYRAEALREGVDGVVHMYREGEDGALTDR
jgi:gamma-glutamyl:cysteine ligase YbdK (ATP-grasp superfamily)